MKPLTPSQGPVMTVPLTPEQVAHVKARILEIDAHFATCCAFQLDECRMAPEYDDLHRLLRTFGEKGPEA